MYRSYLILPFFLLVFGAMSQSFTHPGAMNTKQNLEWVKAKVASNQQPWKDAYSGFLSAKASPFDGITPKPYTSLQYVAHPRASVDCGSFNNPNRGCNDIVYDGMAAYSLALRYYIENDKRYADKAIEILMDWSNTYAQSTESNSDLVTSWAIPWYVNAGEILRYTSGSGWISSNTSKLNGFLNKLIAVSKQEGSPNNQMMSSIEARIAVSIFQDNRNDFNAAIDLWKEHVKTYIYQSSDGSKPINPPGKDDEWTKRLWHDRDRRTGTIYIDGLCMETCRDISHSKLGVTSLLNGAEMAWSQGIDLFDLEKKRFSDFLELHAPWMMEEKTPPNNICDGYLDIISEEAFEIGFSQLHTRLGQNLPNTERMLLKNRPNNANRWVTKWETLCFAERLFSATPVNNPPTGKFIAPTFTSIEEGYTDLYVAVDASDPDNDNISLTLVINGDTIRTENGAPYEWGHVSSNTATDSETQNLAPGNYLFEVIIKDDKGASTTVKKTITITEKGIMLLSPIHDAYIEGTTGKNDELLRLESGKRATYLQFDLSSIGSQSIVTANLKLTVGDDFGAGTIKVYNSSNVSWTEGGINPSNAPVKENLIATKSGTFVAGSTQTFDVVNMAIYNNRVTFVLESDGTGADDVSFASKENTTYTKPVLRLKTDNITGFESSSNENSLLVYPNPSESGVYHLLGPLPYKVYSVTGGLILSDENELIDLTDYPSGIYFLQVEGNLVKLIK